MRFYKLILAFFFLTGNILFAGPLSGTYKIGPGEYFETFNAAVDSLKANGVNGPVVFLVKSGTYSELIDISHINGTSATNTVTFKAETPGENNVILDFETTSHSDSSFIIRMDSVEHLIIDGLTFTPPTRDTYSTYSINLRLGGNKWITIKNNFFSSSTESTHTFISGSSSGIYGPMHNITVNNNKFYGGNLGITIWPHASLDESISDSLFIINDNTFINQKTWSLQLWGVLNSKIFDNKITSSGTGIFIADTKRDIHIYNNLLLMNDENGPGSGIRITSVNNDINSTKNIFVFNNFVKSELGPGIFCQSVNGIRIKNNSVLVKNMFIPSFYDSPLFLAKCDSIEVTDNVFQKVGFGSAITVDTLKPDLVFNRNIYFADDDTIAYHKGERVKTLSEWQSLMPGAPIDVNSTFSKIEYLDTINYDLVHCSTDPSLNFSSFDASWPAEINKDLNGVTRPTNHWPGATELTIDEGKIVKVSGFVAQGTDTLKSGILVAYVDSSDRALLDEVGETTINPDGSFSFDSVPALPMWIKIFPEDSNYLKSYHDSVLRREESIPLNPVDCDGLQTNIFPRRIHAFDFNGLGSIEGYIIYADLGSNKTQKRDPIPGLDVVLDRIPPSKSIKATVTNGDNYYSFEGLPDGTYSVTIEYEGLSADTIYVIDVISSNPRNTDKNYCIDTTRAITMCKDPESTNELDLLTEIYPNPVTSILSIKSDLKLDRLRIYDVRGIVVFEDNINGYFTNFNTSILEPSIYFIEIFSGNSSTIKKIIKK